VRAKYSWLFIAALVVLEISSVRIIEADAGTFNTISQVLLLLMACAAYFGINKDVFLVLALFYGWLLFSDSMLNLFGFYSRPQHHSMPWATSFNT